MKKFIFLAVFSFFNIQAKVLIITFNYSNPEFIKIQKETFTRFLWDEYEFVVYSDAPTQEGHEEIVMECAANGIECIRIPQNIHEHPYYLPLNMPEIYPDHIRPSNVRHVHCVQYALDTRGFDFDGTVILLDSDAFLVRPLNVAKYMKNCDIASFFKGSYDEATDSHIHYCCPVLTFLNMETLPDKKSLNFNCGKINNCNGDSGGFTHYYLKAHPDLRLSGIGSIYGGEIFCSDRFFSNNNDQNANIPLDQKIAFWTQRGFNEKEISFLSKNPDTIQYYTNGKECWFFHYRGGSNYEKLPESYHINKKKMVNDYITEIMNQ